ncbi:unnamed protein product [Effrenium voratum]|uniref:Transmembrane protein n=1 Tax=Effrenium voratum TaxID=2562239 RepID=A0AA36MTK6_9DINO|nr:unnamed protein product [Effrenium voratum]
MRQQRLRMDHFDRSSLLQFHQQAITHALAPQQSQKQMPCQLVFPDDTMAIGSPALPRGALFPAEGENVQESEEERQRRLLQNEPIVVYTSLSEQEVLLPEIAKRGLALLFVVAVQMVCIIVILTGGEASWLFESGETPSKTQVALYSAQLLLQPIFLLAMYLWSPDVLKLYTVLTQLQFVLLAALAIRSPLDLVACGLCLPLVVLGDSLRHLMMPCAQRTTGPRLFPLDEQIDSSLRKVYDSIDAYAARSSLMRAPHSTPENSDIQILPEGFRWRG